MADVDMEEEAKRTAEVALSDVDAAAEKKKALLVYKSNQQSASDDDDDDDADDDDDSGDDDDDDDGEEDEDLDASTTGSAARDEDDDLDDAVSVNSDAIVDQEDDDDDVDVDVDDDDDDDEEEDGGVRVEKDDDESINAPSDDDLDSTATPTRTVDTDEEVSEKSALVIAAKKSAASSVSLKKRFKSDEDGGTGAHDSDSASSARTGSPIKTEEGEGKMITLKSGNMSDVKAIIAARRRTGARKECEVCQEPRNGRRAMLCANCKVMYHSSCYRQRFSKLINASGKQWFCPDCETTKAELADKEASTPRKKREDAGKSRGSRGTKAAPVVKGKDAITGGNETPVVAVDASPAELELKRITEIALRSGKKINNVVLERTEEMLQVTEGLTTEVDSVMGSFWREKKQNGGFEVERERQPPPFTLPVASSSSSSSLGNNNPAQKPLSPVSHSPTNDFKIHGNGSADHVNGGDSTEKDVLLTRVYAGLVSLKNLLQQLQVTGIQFEVDLIKEIKLPPPREEQKSASTSTSTRKAPSSAAAAARASAINKGVKNGASRLYSSKQIHKLEEWYQKSSRPESCEIQAMYRIINCPEYADKELQPEGISVKQIRIWFDNRRAKERLDYMRLKMKDISTTDMDAESVKRMKAAYIDEAKEVLEARVSRLRENGKGPGEIVDEAGDLLLSGEDHALPTGKGLKASPGSKSLGALQAGSENAKPALNPKKRIRIDHVASVRKAVKEARDSGKSEEETKAIRAAAIERARERVHIPYKNARQGPTKPLGKDEVTHIKLKMLKLLEEDATAEELTDLIELLLTVIIPRDILIESALHRQLNLVLKAHKDNKELVKQTNRLLDEFNMIVEKGDSVFDSIIAADEAAKNKQKKKKDTSLLLDVDTESLPDTPGASPDSPAASPDSRRPRVKFSLDQLVKLEKYFHKDDTPSKKKLDKLADKLNEIGARDPASDEAQKSIDYKQIRCWFYKRRSTNQRPQALTSLDIQEVGSSSSLSESETDSDDEGSVSSKAPVKAKSAAKRKAPAAAPAASESGKAPAAKRSKKEPATAATGSEAKAAPARSSSSKKEGKKEAVSVASASSSKVKDASGKHAGRIFNVKQLATIIEEYEKNPRPSVARLEELQNILNQDDHADDNFVNPTGVTKRQIKTWFSNRRAKERLDLIKMKVQDGGKSADADTADSETEDEDRVETKKAVKKKSDGGNDTAAGEATRKELFVLEDAPEPPSAVNQDVDMGSDDDVDDDLSEAESEKSAPPAQSTGSKMPSMRMLVDDDDDSEDDDDDDEDEDDDDVGDSDDDA